MCKCKFQFQNRYNYWVYIFVSESLFAWIHKECLEHQLCLLNLLFHSSPLQHTSIQNVQFLKILPLINKGYTQNYSKFKYEPTCKHTFLLSNYINQSLSYTHIIHHIFIIYNNCLFIYKIPQKDTKINSNVKKI